jgi:hypothetical protein
MIACIDSAWLNVLELFSDANREVFLKYPQTFGFGLCTGWKVNLLATSMWMHLWMKRWRSYISLFQHKRGKQGSEL